jgi:hypothetical protein
VFTIVLLSVEVLIGQEDSLKFIELDEIKISYKKEIAYGDKRYFITDFHVGDRGTFILMKRFSKYVIYHLDDNMEPKAKLHLNFRPTRFFNDCLGYLHIMARDSIHQLEIVSDSLVVWESNSIHFYNTYLKNCVGANKNGMINKRYVNFNQTLAYYQDLKKDKTRKRIYTVEDSVALRSIIEQAQDLSGGLPFEFLKGQELDSIQLKYARERYNAQQFFFRHVVKPVFNPLHVKDDTSYVFDHVNSKVVSISDTGAYLSGTPIDYHKSKYWEERLLYDKKQKRFYALEMKGGVHTWLLLSSKNFKVIRRTKITEHAYPEKVIIYDGYAYYLYKKDLNDNLNKLFRQRVI